MQKNEFTEYFEQMTQIFSRFQKLSSALDQFEQKYMNQEEMQLENELNFEILLEQKFNQKNTEPLSLIKVSKNKGEKQILQSSKLKKKQPKQIKQHDSQIDKRKASYIDYEL